VTTRAILPTINDEQCRESTSELEFVGRRWTGGVLLALGRGATRFGEVQAAVDGLSSRMLALRLRELEERGVVARTVEPTTPVSVRYGLTEQGRELLTAVQPLVAYADRWHRHTP
jgi:DNA-binding HxlR family transcriptional regulator